MERNIERTRRRRRNAEIRPREGGTLEDDAKFYILRGWLLRAFDKKDDLQEAVTGALRASVGWLLESQDEEALEMFRDACGLFEITLTGIRGRRMRKAAHQAYHALFGELLRTLEDAQHGMLRGAAVLLCFYSAVTDWSKGRDRWFERAYELMCACGADGEACIPLHIRAGLLLNAARLRRRRQPGEAIALYEQVVAMGEENLRMAEDPAHMEAMLARRLLLFHAWDASASLFLLHLCRLRLLLAVKWYLRMAALCFKYLSWRLHVKLGALGDALKELPSFLLKRREIQALLFAWMMTMLLAMAYMCMNR